MNQYNKSNLITYVGIFIMTLSLSPAKGHHHSIITVNSVYEVKIHLDQANQDSLIFFDIDSTLTTPSDPYLRRHAIKRHKTIYDNLLTPLTPNQKRIFNHLLVIDSPSQLVEEDWPTIIKELQEREIKTLALTAAKTGPISSILPSFPNWRYSELERLGIHFSTAFPGTVLFKDLEDFGGDFPGIEKGIVYCGHQASKGDLLLHILSAIKFTPALIIFVDDKRENLESLSDAIQQSFPSLHFIGIHYTGMEQIENPLTEEHIFHKKFHTLTEKAKNIAF